MKYSQCCHLFSAKLYTHFFTIMWATGYTPETWETSETILTDKEKGDKTGITSL